MKKTIIIILSFILFGLNAISQEVLDTTVLKCKYTFRHITSLSNNSGYTEQMILEVGRNICKLYSETNIIYLESINNAIGHGKREIIMPNVDIPNVNTILYFNYPNKKITIFDKIVVDNYEFQESIENINWQFIPDVTRELLGYICKKAKCTFRGRDYDIWYAPDSSVNAGVWKFSGLPGLILRITDSKLQVQFVCESVEKVSIPITMNKITDIVIQTTRKEFMNLERKFYENSAAILGANEIGTGWDANGNPLPPRKNLPYNPIELE